MSGLFGGGGDINTTAPIISSLRLQTSCYGGVVPWFFGKTRGAPNVIQYEDFTPIAHTTSQSAGGKGGGPTMSSTSYTYTAAMIMALCSGPIAGVGRIWKGKEVSSAGALKLDVYAGDSTQLAHAYFAGAHPDRALAYRGIAYVASGAYDLGEAGTLDNHSFEVQMPGAIAPSVPDANIKDVIAAILTDPEQGLGLAPERIGDLTPFSDFCLANGIWVSPAYTEQRAGYEQIKSLLQIGYADCVYSGGVFKIVPYSDAPAAGAFGTYTPQIAPVYALTDDDFLRDGDSGDPVKVLRKSQADAYNHVQVKFLDRANDYNESVAEWKDDADIELHGLRTMPPVELHEICDAGVAAKVAEFLGRRSLYIRNEYEFKLPWSYALLEPMDVVTLTSPGCNLDGVPVLLIEVGESDDDSGIAVRAEDYPLGAHAVTLRALPTTDGYTPDFSIAPGNSTVPVLFEPPLQLTGNDPQLWLAAAGGPNWGGADIWVSTDNVSYRKIGRMQGPSRYGALSAPLAPGAAIDTLNILAVDLSASRGVLQGGTHGNAQDLVTLCYADGEYLAFADAALTGVNAYNLSYLVRGAYGTDIAAHAAGTPFVRLDDGLFKYSYPKEWLGKGLWVKLVSFNPFGGGLQDMATVPAYQVTLQGAPLGVVQDLRFEQEWQGRELKIAWDLLDGADSYDVDVYAGTPAAPVRSTRGLTNPRFVYAPDDMKADGGPWRDLIVKVRGRSITGKTGQFAQLLAHNAQVAALTGIQIDRGIGQVFFRCMRPADSDFAGILVWLSADPECPAVQVNLVADAAGTVFPLARLPDGTPLVGGTTYYLRAAAYDEFGKDGLNLSSVLAVSPYSATINQFDLDPDFYAPIAQVTAPENLVNPTSTVAQQAQSAAEAALTLLTKTDSLNDTVAGLKWITDAIATVDPSTGQVTLIATAEITTDVENRVHNVELGLDAVEGTITSHTQSIADHGGRIGTAETEIAQLQDEIQLKASASYVDGTVAQALGSVDPQAIQDNADANAAGTLQLLLDADAARKAGQASQAKIAAAIQTLAAHADALQSEAVERTILTAQVNLNAAGLVQEQQARADAYAAEAAARLQLEARVTTAENGLTANAARLQQEEQVRANGDSANASSIQTLVARLDTGDYAAVKQQSSVTASKVGQIEAKHVLKVDANGHVAGMELLSDGTTGQIAMLADRFLWVKPDGSGTPVQLLALWTDPSDNTAKLGLLGDLLVDGTIAGNKLVADAITTRELAAQAVTATEIAAEAIGTTHLKARAVKAGNVDVDKLSAISANLGDISGGTINIGNKFLVAADGTTTIRSGTAGQRVEIDINGGRVYDANGTLRVRWGIW